MKKICLALLATALGSVGLAAPASAHGDQHLDPDRVAARMGTVAAPVQTAKIAHVGANPGQAGISGCFMRTAPVFVTSGLDSVRVYDVSDPSRPRLTGILPNLVFENEAMNCGERRTAQGVKRFALIGVDLVQAAPGDVEHVNVGGGELIVVDVTDPSSPRIRSRAPGSTSTHTVACVDETDCTYAYSAGDNGVGFSIFDLRDLDAPREVDSNGTEAGVQPFSSPTAGHKWNFDAAGIGTHTGFEGASMWSTERPRRPRLLTTTGPAGRGEDPRFPGWNDFILHNAFRPNAKAFKPGATPALANGNVLLVTEEDYEDTDCSTAGSFQTWWVKRLDGTPSAIVPLDKVELADLGTYPLPRGAFCSSHWFDYRSGGLVAAGFYGGGTQVLDVRNPRDIRSYAASVWGASEVWDSMWVPVYRDGRQTGARTNVLYSIDLLRGLDVYAVDIPGDGKGAVADGTSARTARSTSDVLVPAGMVGGAFLLSALLGRIRTSGRRRG
jgi:LVIVD repeat